MSGKYVYKSNIFISSIISFSILFVILYFSKFGLDITDEGFYLNSISNPWMYGIGVTLFSYVYHFIYILLFKNIYFLRLFNIFSIFLLAWILVSVLIKQYFSLMSEHKVWREFLIINLSVLCLTYIFPFSWLITPSYNSLNFQGLLIASIGLLLLSIPNLKSISFAYLILGLGGAVVFLAKPSSAVLLSFAVLIYFFLIKNINLKLIYMSFFSAFFLIVGFLFLISPSMKDLMDSIQFSIGNYQLISSRSIFRVEFYPLSAKDIRYVVFIWLLLILICSNYIPILKKNKNIFQAIFYIYFIILGGYSLIKNINPFHYIQFDYIFLPLFGFLLIFFLLFRNFQMNLMQKNALYLGGYFFLLPHIFAFGTSNSYWHQSQLACFFWIISSLCVFFSIFEKKYLIQLYSIINTFALILMVYLLKASLVFPYRQDSFLNYQHYELLRINEDSTLYVNKGFANCITTMRKKLSQLGFKHQTALVDFSGNYPSLVYLFDGVSPGMAWFLDVGNNNVRFLNKVLEPVFIKGKSNWILLDSENIRFEQSQVFKHLMIDLNKQYDLVLDNRCRLYETDEKQRRILIYRPRK